MPKYAFVSYVDQNYIDGFLALLNSVILNCHYEAFDFVVLYDDLSPHDRKRIRHRYDRIIFREIDRTPYDSFKKGLRSNYLAVKAYFVLEAFKLEEYDSVVALDTDMVVLSDITDLFHLDVPFAACPQFFNPEGGNNLNSGLLVISGHMLGVNIWEELCEVGRSGSYELEKHDQGILSAYFKGVYHQLHHSYNTVKRRLLNKSVPSSVKILHFTGPIKPWDAAEPGYEQLQKVWQRYDLEISKYLALLVNKAVKARNYPVVLFAARQYTRLIGASPSVVLNAFPAFRSSGLWDEARQLLEHAPTEQQAVKYSLYLRYLGETYCANEPSSPIGLMFLSQAYAMGEPVGKLVADAAWVAHEMDIAKAMADDLFFEKPSVRANRVLKRRVNLSKELEAQAQATLKTKTAVSHAAFYMTRQGNAGDIVLPWSVRGSIETGIGKTDWLPVHVHQAVLPEVVDRINATRGLVIGGGGLFLADTGANQVSGWQWNISNAQLNRIAVPINVFAVGYNLFYAHDRLSQRFSDSISVLLEKSNFFGLRNSGSIAALKTYVPATLADKISFQPCPTTVLMKTHTHLFNQKRRKGYIALNIALDRASMRFGASYEDFLSQMAVYIREISKEAPIRYFAHAVVDEQFLIDLARYEGISLRAVRLYDMTEEEMVKLYQEPYIVVGMRGHAGMIPFGCGTPIISLVTHPKLRYFLEDVFMPECAIDVGDSLAETLLDRTRDILSDHDGYVTKVDAQIERLWEITKANVNIVSAGL